MVLGGGGLLTNRRSGYNGVDVDPLPTVPARIDPERIASLGRIFGGTKRFSEILSEHVAHARKLVDDAEQALAANDGKKLQRAAHTLRSGSAMFGLRDVAMDAGNLENSAQKGDFSQCAEILSGFRARSEPAWADLLELSSRV